MFANGGYISPALRYMAQNPDVFNASVANARARGLTGINSQGQVERDAALHYAFHGKGEGRQYGGRTFLGGLLEPRLGDTFGLSPERKQELENERDNIANPPVELPTAPARGLVPLVPIDGPGGIDDVMGGGMAEGGIVSLANGGEVEPAFESSPVIQGYLEANSDVLESAVRIAESKGLPKGQNFQQEVERAALEHWNMNGRKERRTVANFSEDGGSLMDNLVNPSDRYLAENPDVADAARKEFIKRGERGTPLPEYQRRFARDHFYNSGREEGRQGFGISRPDVDSRMMNIAKLLRGTRNVVSNEGIGSRAFFGTAPDGTFYEPDNPRSAEQLEGILRGIDSRLWSQASGAFAGDANEDMMARDVSNTIRRVDSRQGPFGVRDSYFTQAGGTPELARAFAQLGPDTLDPTGQRGTSSYGANTEYQTVGGVPLSLGNMKEYGILSNLNNRISQLGSRLNPNEVPGQGIQTGIETVRLDDTAEINPLAGEPMYDNMLSPENINKAPPLQPALIPGTGNPTTEFQGYGNLSDFFDSAEGIYSQAQPIVSYLSGIFGGDPVAGAVGPYFSIGDLMETPEMYMNNPDYKFFNPANDPFGTDGMDGSDSLSGVSISNRMADILGYSDLTNNFNQNAVAGEYIGLAPSLSTMPEGNRLKAGLESNFPGTMEILNTYQPFNDVFDGGFSGFGQANNYGQYDRSLVD